MSRVVRNIRFVVPLPAEEHLCSKRRDQKCKTLWGGYADDPGTDGARHWAKWRGDRAEATGQRARPKADGQSCTLATPRGSSIRVPIGRLSPEAFSRGVFASGRETLPQRENWLSPPHPERPTPGAPAWTDPCEMDVHTCSVLEAAPMRLALARSGRKYVSFLLTSIIDLRLNILNRARD